MRMWALWWDKQELLKRLKQKRWYRQCMEGRKLVSSGEKIERTSLPTFRYGHFSRAFLEEQLLCSQLHWQQVTNCRAHRATSNSREQELSRQERSFLQRLKHCCLQDRQGPSWSSFNDLSSKRNQPELSLPCPHHSFSGSSGVSFNQLHYFVWPSVSDLAVVLSELLAI